MCENNSLGRFQDSATHFLFYPLHRSHQLKISLRHFKLYFIVWFRVVGAVPEGRFGGVLQVVPKKHALVLPIWPAVCLPGTLPSLVTPHQCYNCLINDKGEVYGNK
jgi:hypothetical protein